MECDGKLGMGMRPLQRFPNIVVEVAGPKKTQGLNSAEQTHAADQSRESEDMVAVHVGYANEFNFLKGNSVFPDGGLYALTGVK